MFGGVLLDSRTVLSSTKTDLFLQFVPWREFGFGELRNGRLALWNPYLFSGMPYFGGFQSALLYPPNLLHLILPLAVSINCLMALHIFLSGFFMYLWAANRGLHPLAATVGGALFMFGGTQFPHIYAGHLPHICAMPWAVLLFLAIDGFLETRGLRWCLLGMGALAMQILAGFPQYVYYTAVAAVVYSFLRMARTPAPKKTVAGLAAIFAGAAGLAAVQLLAGMDAASQSVRGQGVPYQFAAMFSFPPENLLTLVAPNFFGDGVGNKYWGRCYLWEMSLFMGVAGLVLAVFGVIRGERRLRLFSLPLALILLLLALGSHTPLFKILYQYLPGFGVFRGSSKFTFPASLFLAMLAGVGLHTLLKSPLKDLRLPLCVGGTALAALAAGVVLTAAASNGPALWWRGVMNAMLATGESYLPPQLYSQPEFAAHAAADAGGSLFLAGATLAFTAGLLWALRYGRLAAYGIALLAVLEVFVFALSWRATFEIAAATASPVQRFLEQHPGDYRVLNLMDPNSSLLAGKGDLWGYDHGVLRRYAQFMAFTQKEDPDQATQYLEFKVHSPLYRMLRLKYIFFRDGPKVQVGEIKAPLERLHLIYDYDVLNGRDRIFEAMSGDFDPASKVILETQPWPKPLKMAENRGEARILGSSTDHLEIQADLPNPALLLITDGYDKGWRAFPLDESAQTEYQVMPANYVLMAVPLGAGRHHFRLEYAPRAFAVGKWISLLSLTAFLGAAGELRRRKKALSHSSHPVHQKR